MATNRFTAPLSVIVDPDPEERKRVNALRERVTARLLEISRQSRGGVEFAATAFEPKDELSFVVRSGVLDDDMMDLLRREFPGCSHITRGQSPMFLVPKAAPPKRQKLISIERAGYMVGMVVSCLGAAMFSGLLGIF